MANQGLDRRTVLEMLGKAALASQFPGFTKWAFAGDHQHSPDGGMFQRQAGPYRPQYFQPAEFHTLDVLTELIIPADRSPGAREAGVAEFIDFLAAHGEDEIRQPMRDGLAWLDRTAKVRHGSAFVSLRPEQQTEILKSVAYAANTAPQDVQGRTFFLLARRYTVMGYYTSRAGMQELDYPGLKLYSASPACPHTDDPEHRHLPAPKI
jgi:gluconate 2-dehydrogenase gamma chain